MQQKTEQGSILDQADMSKASLLPVNQ